MISKTPGASCSATLTFNHKGGGGNFDVGIGLAPATDIIFLHNNVQDWFALLKAIPSHANFTPVTVVVNFLWPSGYAAGKYDALKFIQVAGGYRNPAGGSGFLLDDWDDDVYKQEAMANEFNNLVATYT